jgi:phosphinothricin acetyltransferase
MSGYSIRDMIKADWPRVREIYRQGIEGNLATFQTECPSWDEWDDAHIRTCRLVITKEDFVVGWAALTAVSGRCGYAGVAEASLYIDTDSHGKGVGTELLSELIHVSENAGFWTLQSGIMKNNAASIRLHEKCGFRMVGYRERIGKDRFGVWRDTVLMEKRSALSRYK